MERIANISDLEDIEAIVDDLESIGDDDSIMIREIKSDTSWQNLIPELFVISDENGTRINQK